jgi:Arc/MetJ family transcription regulator
MRRTQLYLDDQLWATVHAQALREKTTVSDLLRQAVRERFGASQEQRKADMLAAIGIWKDRPEFDDPEAYIRNLREDDRMERLHAE